MTKKPALLPGYAKEAFSWQTEDVSFIATFRLEKIRKPEVAKRPSANQCDWQGQIDKLSNSNKARYHQWHTN
jgi:hypothetical protein